MKNLNNLFTLIFLGLLLSSNSLLATSNPNLSVQSINFVKKPPELVSQSYFLVDFNSGKILAESNADERLAPASLTKIMTVYVIGHELKNGRLKMDDLIKVSNKAYKAEGSRMFLNLNSLVTVDEILKGIIIQSANDGCVAIAEHIAGTESEFAEIMNGYAESLGMKNSHFENSTGMPSKEHYSSARDMAIVSKALIKDFPDLYKLFSEKEYTYNNIKQYNRNSLMGVLDYVDGIKTGFTDEAGYCLVSSGEKNGTRLIAVTFKAPNAKNRVNDSKALMVWGFRSFETAKMYSKHKAIAKAPVWMGVDGSMPVGIEDDLFVTVYTGQSKTLEKNIELNEPLKAPIRKGDVIGKVKINCDNCTVCEVPVVALKDVEESNFISRSWDYVHMKIKGLTNMFGITKVNNS